MKLYYAPGACSLAVHIALREANLEFQTERVDLATKKTETGADFTRINPKGYVPTLVLDDGTVLTEASAILQYVADRNPGASLAPAAGMPERYRLLEWLGFVATELHKGFSPLWKPDTPGAYKKIAREMLAKRFAYLDAQLGGQPYLMGQQFTVADAYAYTVLNWTKFQNIDLAPYPNLSAYMARVAARPNVQAALKAEGLIKEAA